MLLFEATATVYPHRLPIFLTYIICYNPSCVPEQLKVESEDS